MERDWRCDGQESLVSRLVDASFGGSGISAGTNKYTALIISIYNMYVYFHQLIN